VAWPKVMALACLLMGVEPNDALHRITVHVAAPFHSGRSLRNVDVTVLTRAGQFVAAGRTDVHGTIVLENVPGYLADLAVGYEGCPHVRETLLLNESEVVHHVRLPAIATLAVVVTGLSDDGITRKPVNAAFVKAEYGPSERELSTARLTDSAGRAALCVLAGRDFKLTVQPNGLPYAAVAKDLRIASGKRLEQAIELPRVNEIRN